MQQRPRFRIQRVVGALEGGFSWALGELCELVRIPGVSARGFDPGEVVRSAEAVAALLERVGLERVELLRQGDAHPYVVGEWLGAGPEAPTALLYAHHDVQPPGRLERWETPPFEPARRADGRLYGRGVVDDKAGVLVYAAAVRAWLAVEGRLPLNVKFLVEGEEETGSAHLADFLAAHRERLEAEVIVLSDTANLEAGLPSITTSLRGLVNVDVAVRALDHPLHSGLWGGPVPEAASALSLLLARLFDADGEPAVPGLDEDVPPISRADRAALAALPFDGARFRADAGMARGAPLLGEADRSVYERLWLRPSISVVALEAAPLATATNQLVPEARARVGVRLAPGQDPVRVSRLLVNLLERDPPRGVSVRTEVESTVAGWRTTPEGPAFDAARRALERGFGRPAVHIGCGGSIPFVGPFARVLGGAPALLLGLEDPVCNAHGENESLNVEDFEKAQRAAVHLLAELAGIGRPPPAGSRRASQG